MSETEPYGLKRNALIAAGKLGHKVAVIGESVFTTAGGPVTNEDIALEGVEVKLFSVPTQYPEIGELSDYSLVIFNFEIESHQEYFSKQIITALDNGVNFCFVHYNHDGTQGRPLTVEDSIVNSLYQRQIGLQAVWERRIQTYRANAPFKTGKIHRNEFKSFLEKYGSSHNFFHSDSGFDDVIYTTGENNLALGFALNSSRGKIIVLPFMRDVSRKEAVVKGPRTLIDSLLTYITSTLAGIPDWAETTAFFSQESDLIERREQLENALAEVNEGLSTFREAKGLLFQRKYTLEASIPRFLSDSLSVKTEREERYKEDFWILDENDNRAAIAEVKSVNKGMSEQAIYSVITHRDEYGLASDFPAILFVNQFLQAGSWSTKDHAISGDNYRFAAQRNVLIVRIEDLVRLWDASRSEKVPTQKVFSLLTENKGWLQVTSDLKLQIKPQISKRPSGK